MEHPSSETGLIVRKMEHRDLDRVLAIATALQTAPKWVRSVYEEAIASPNGSIRVALVAEFPETVVGFVVASVVAPQGEIESIAVARDVQGHGVGFGLLQAALEELGRAGVTEVHLEVRASGERALRVYSRAGFSEVGRRRGYYRDPAEDAVLMRLPQLGGLSTV